MKTEIAEELKSLFRDYGIGSQRRGRRYPDPVKSRIFELMKSGISVGKISSATGISVVTLMSWNQALAPKHFKQISILPAIDLPSKIRVFLNDKIWIEIEEKNLTVELIGKLKAAS